MRAAAAFFLLAVAPAALLALSACDDLNRPLGHPHAEPRRKCFSDVECPSNLKCTKGPQDIEGQCVPRTAADEGGAPPSTSDEAGAPGLAPMPSVTAAPGDIQI
jgi:hypothetical protein